MNSVSVIFDRKLLAQRRARARALGPSSFLIDGGAADLAERLAAVLRRFERSLDLGTPVDALRRVLAASPNVGEIVGDVAFDEEALPFRDASLDLVVSGLALQFVND